MNAIEQSTAQESEWSAYINGRASRIHWHDKNGVIMGTVARELSEQDAQSIVANHNGAATSRKALQAALDMLHELHHDHADNWPEHQVNEIKGVGELIHQALGGAIQPPPPTERINASVDELFKQAVHWRSTMLHVIPSSNKRARANEKFKSGIANALTTLLATHPAATNLTEEGK